MNKNNTISVHRITTTYLVLILLNTLATSMIWGINTLFLLEAGLNNTQAFLANAFFTLGQVIFEVPTGLVADTKGRRLSYLLGTLTLSAATVLYLLAWQVQAPFVAWAISSMVLGLGFTFFSGATEAWLVDALDWAKHSGSLDAVFGKGQAVSGVAMLVGSVAGGVIAQATDLSVPYIVRAVILIINFGVAFVFMKDWGFEPERRASVWAGIKELLQTSFKFGWRKKPIRWMMLAAPFSSGVGFYTFYAMQPYLLELYADKDAYGVAGLAAAIVAGAQIVGGMIVPQIRKRFRTRTAILMTGTALTCVLLVLVGRLESFWVAVGLLCVWGLIFATTMPVRQAYLNGLIPAKQRATVLSFDSLMGSSGGAVIQPVLGRAADVWSYGTSFVIGAVVQSAALFFLWLARREKAESDEV